MNEPIDARKLSVAEYAASKAELTRWDKKPAPHAAQFDRKKLDVEIAAFEAAGLKSAMSENTSSTSAPPTPAKTVTDSKSATEMSDSEYRQMKRDIAYGKVPALNATDRNFA